jgi:hypothetical protein
VLIISVSILLLEISVKKFLLVSILEITLVRNLFSY